MARKVLRISKSLALPIDAVTETIGILAIKGVGKSYLEMLLAEQMLANNLPIIPIDSMGIFWGLRAHANGRSKGLPITIMGGDHADVPLVPTAGRVVAELLARENFACILDVSDFRKNEQRRFVMEFAEEFYHKKKKFRDPVHIFLDEADLWAPQRVDKGYERLHGAIDDIVRRGRQRGIGCTMATQRAAVISKSVLGQVSILIAMQMSGAQDIDAVTYWISKCATKEGREKFLQTIPTLQKGEAFVWSPALLRIFKRIKISQRWTFDSSRTPKVGERLREPKKMASVDLKKIKTAIESTIESQKSDDPRVLKARIRELQLQLSTVAATVEVKRITGADTSEDFKRAKATIKELSKTIVQLRKQKVKFIDRPFISNESLRRLEQICKSLETTGKKIFDSATGVRNHADSMRLEGKRVDKMLKTAHSLMEMGKKAAKMPIPELKTDSFVIKEPMRKLSPKWTASEPPQLKLRAGEKGILQALFTLGGSGTVHQVGALAGFPANGSTFRTYRNVLVRNKLVGMEDGQMVLTNFGERYVPDTMQITPRTTAEIVEMWNKRLRKGERDMLAVLVEAKGMGLEPLDVMEKAGIASLSTYRTYRNVLIRNLLAESLENGLLAAHPTLFPRSA